MLLVFVSSFGLFVMTGPEINLTESCEQVLVSGSLLCPVDPDPCFVSSRATGLHQEAERQLPGLGRVSDQQTETGSSCLASCSCSSSKRFYFFLIIKTSLENVFLQVKKEIL